MLKALFVGLIFCFVCDGANILGIFYHPGRSHHKLGETLLKAMAKRGHKVTMVSPYPLKEPFPNYKDIHLFETQDDMNERIRNNWFQNFQHNSVNERVKSISMILNMTKVQTDLTFQNKEFQKLWKSNKKFDLIITDWIVNESHLIFGKIFDSPIIVLGTAGTYYNVNYLVRNMAPYSYVPIKYLPLTEDMSFYERVLNTVVDIICIMLTHFYQINLQQEVLNKYFPYEQIEDLFKYVALIISNGHYSVETLRPAVPNVIEVGGYHVGGPKPLPKDLKKYLDEAKEGFIYFSLGSNMKSVFLEGDKIEGVLRAFSKIPMKIVWKFEGELVNKSDNVYTGNWFPQNDILAHPNIKLFITHGGLLSTIESIYHGVPMIGIPMFGDQHSNVLTGVKNGFALQINSKDISEESFLQNISEIINNPKYKEKAKFHSQLMREQPMKPLDRAIYWMEYVIKNKGAPIFRNASMDLSWYQYMLIDVILFLFAILLLILATIYLLLKQILKLFKKHQSSRKVDKKSAKKNK